jgi:hypothetical protein
LVFLLFALEEEDDNVRDDDDDKEDTVEDDDGDDDIFIFFFLVLFTLWRSVDRVDIVEGVPKTSVCNEDGDEGDLTFWARVRSLETVSECKVGVLNELADEELIFVGLDLGVVIFEESSTHSYPLGPVMDVFLVLFCFCLWLRHLFKIGCPVLISKIYLGESLQ